MTFFFSTFSILFHPLQFFFPKHPLSKKKKKKRKKKKKKKMTFFSIPSSLLPKKNNMRVGEIKFLEGSYIKNLEYFEKELITER